LNHQSLGVATRQRRRRICFRRQNMIKMRVV
jgi:hypothetical protein